MICGILFLVVCLHGRSLDTLALTWELVPQSLLKPSPRGYAAAVSSGNLLYFFGGARCNPGCKCNNELWILNATSLRSGWKLSDDSISLPQNRYRHSLSKITGGLVVFGGESFSPKTYFNDLHLFELEDVILNDHLIQHPILEDFQAKDTLVIVVVLICAFCAFILSVACAYQNRRKKYT